MAVFEQGLYIILTDSIDTLELDASFEEFHGVPSLVLSAFPCSVGTISDTSKLQLAPSIKCHKLLQVRALLWPVPVAGQDVSM